MPPLAGVVTLDGGEDIDLAVLTGTNGNDEVSISTGPSDAHVNLIDVENGSFDGSTCTDVLVYQGMLRVVGVLDLLFQHTELLDLLANLDNLDTATCIGTNQADEFSIKLAAEGTNSDPALQWLNPDSPAVLLTLRDYRNFGTLVIEGRDGADIFNVFVAPAGPGTGRDLAIDGGDPDGGQDGMDVLNVFFETPDQDIDHDKHPQNSSGTFDVLYPLHQFFIEYSNIELALAKSNAAS